MGAFCVSQTYLVLSGAPCLSFDILPDKLGENREQYPMTCFTVAGTQADIGRNNHVIVMKMSNLNKIPQPKKKAEDEDKDEEESSESEEEEEDEDEKPILETALVKHRSGAVNRIRVCTFSPSSSLLHTVLEPS